MMVNRLGRIVSRPVRRTFQNSVYRLKHASTVDITRPNNSSNKNSIDSFDLGNGDYVEAMYKAWQNNPEAVHLSWQIYFNNFTNNQLPFYQPPPTLISTNFNHQFDAKSNSVKVPTKFKINQDVEMYRKQGHLYAHLNPLKKTDAVEKLQLLDGSTDEMVPLGTDILPGFFNQGVEQLSMKDIHQIYQDTYCKSTGYEFTHLDEIEQQFLKSKIEAPRPPLSTETKVRAMEKVLDTHYFELIFAQKFKTVKRYGIEGADSMIPALSHLFDYSAELGIQEVVLGMPHRGRLNLFCNLMGQPVENVYNEFSGEQGPTHPWSNDSSYHLPVTHTHSTLNGSKVGLSLSANPSHLEAVNPVTLGTARFKQQQLGKSKVLPILLHGDAAVAGQGVVYETQGLQDLTKFSVGGTIHMVVNNQIGFTTNPTSSRSTKYCCDIAKMNQNPIIHVNGDEIEAVLQAMQLAVEFRQQFHKDVFIDLITYRRHGHNEVDQPKYTQPKMYAKVDQHPRLVNIVQEQLVNEKTITKSEVEKMHLNSKQKFERSYEVSKSVQVTSLRWVTPEHQDLLSHQKLTEGPATFYPTAAQLEHLEKTTQVISTYPDSLNVHPNLIKVLKSRAGMVKEDKIDWPTAELLAFGSLLQEKHSIRISGQDVERGTFSQRHATLIDQQNEQPYVPLNGLSKDQAKLEVCNSSLSEFAVLGYELGHSLNNYHGLNLWEAQFGDFANVAQPMIDNFIASGELKWLQTSNLVINLPHGFDGNGPEHSSGRLERFLQLTHEDVDVEVESSMAHQLTNWSIVTPTTPANYFHVLRRQLKRNFRKPLICFNGKSILRSPDARSKLSELTDPNITFEPTYPEAFPEDLVPDEEIQNHIICSGQVYYTLVKHRKLNGITHTAISRIEELTPFPFTKVQELVGKYPNAQLKWVQEEPYGMGGYNHILPRFLKLKADIKFVGRNSNAAVAVGNKTVSKKEVELMLEKAFQV